MSLDFESVYDSYISKITDAFLISSFVMSAEGEREKTYD